jgi:putative transposase
MHLTLKKEATKPAAANFPATASPLRQVYRRLQQRTSPRSSGHEVSLRGVPTLSSSPIPDCQTIDYPFHDKTIVVTRCGRICLGAKKINFSQVFAGQAVGIKEVHDDIWLVSFMEYDLGYFDLEARVLEPLENPFGPKVLPMS